MISVMEIFTGKLLGEESGEVICDGNSHRKVSGGREWGGNV